MVTYSSPMQIAMKRSTLRYWERVLADAENEMTVNGQLCRTTRVSLVWLAPCQTDLDLIKNTRKEVDKFKAELVRLRLLS